jgi:hypothetical protein
MPAPSPVSELTTTQCMENINAAMHFFDPLLILVAVFSIALGIHIGRYLTNRETFIHCCETTSNNN